MTGCKKNRATPLWVGVALAGLLTGPTEAASKAFELALPIRCTPGQDCFVQNYFDRDSGVSWRDFACGKLSYDGHAATDFRLRSLRQMAQGVEVLAAAAGTVGGIRDGEPDVSIRRRPLAPDDKKQAGNAVRIDHGDGWTTQYSHLQKGSVRVRPGQRVNAGEVLGRVGLSGKTEFPHLDFGVRKDGQSVDPFAPDAAVGCGQMAAPLWSPPVARALAYLPSGILQAGFADRMLSTEEVEAGDRFLNVLATTAPAIVFQVEVFGPRAGDVEAISLLDPIRRTLAEDRQTVDRDQAVRRVYIGKRRARSDWVPGTYVGKYVLRRAGVVVVETVLPIELLLSGSPAPR